MTIEGYIVVAVIIMIIVILAKEIMRPGLVLFSASILLMITNIISNEEMLAGFSNKGMITVGLLFLVSEGVRQSGILDRVAQTYLPSKRGKIPFLIPRIIIPVSLFSAFLNNTPVVIIFAPIIKKWAEKLSLPAKKFLIPLSYATIFGGVCTLIGTTTNLVVHGLIIENGYKGFSMFELGKVGIFLMIGGTLFLSIFGNKLLPGKKTEISNGNTADQKDYYYDVIVKKNSNLIGKEISQGHLDELKKLTVRCIERENKTIPVREGKHIIKKGDKLLLAGKSDRLNYILNNDNVSLKGLDLIKNIPKNKLKQYEAVISPRFPGVGKTISEFNFYDLYQAVVLAVHRNGERITSNLNNLPLKPGDNLVLLTTDKFIESWGESRIFYLTSYIRDYRKTGSFWKKWFAFIILLLMIFGGTAGQYFQSPDGVTLDMFFFSALAAISLIWLKVMPHQNYTKAISWDVLITVACAFAISKAMQNSGAAESIAKTTINFASKFGPVGIMAAIYIITTIFTEIITNNAAAALVFPIALSAAQQLNVDPKPFFVAITIAASASFATPIGYQTNLIVQAIGNYKFTDFLKVGIPINILAFIISILLIPLFWHF